MNFNLLSVNKQKKKKAQYFCTSTIFAFYKKHQKMLKLKLGWS